MARHKRHEDRSICPEGTRKVPLGFRPCCDMFEGHTNTCYYDIRYEWWPKSKSWFIIIPDAAGGGGIIMSYCPHCGTKLKPAATRRSAKRDGRSASR